MSELQTEEETQGMSSHEVEKIEEAKLKAKYPTAARPGPGGHSAFLQKRLAKGVSTELYIRIYLQSYGLITSFHF